MESSYITQELLLSLFTYNKESGDLIWNERDVSEFKTRQGWISFNRRRALKPVEGIMTSSAGKKYGRVKVLGKTLLVHRVIWFMVYGKWPECIDHINGNGLDNRIENIREVTIAENNRNLRLNKLNKTGYSGVGECKRGWQTHIWIDNKQINIGVYDTKAEAVAARRAAEKVAGYHKNHGEKRPL